jgi:hypothetical protein
MAKRPGRDRSRMTRASIAAQLELPSQSLELLGMDA